MNRAARAVLAGLFALTMLLASVSLAGVAGAHAVLTGTDPGRDAQLAAGPAQVSATFNEQLQTTFAAMTVVGPDRHLWSTGEARVHGAIVSVALRPLGPVGTYTVNYRVTSADGHVVSGSWPFELTTAGTGEPGPPVAPPAGSPTVHRSADSDGEIPIWPFAVGTVLIVGAGLWFARPRS